MTETKWTPGEWDVSKVGYVHKNGVLHPLPVDEGRLDGESWIDMRKRLAPEFGKREAEAEANAHLIAASPTMASALDEIATELAGILNEIPRDDDTENAWRTVSVALDVALSALAKARGE